MVRASDKRVERDVDLAAVGGQVGDAGRRAQVRIDEVDVARSGRRPDVKRVLRDAGTAAPLESLIGAGE